MIKLYGIAISVGLWLVLAPATFATDTDLNVPTPSFILEDVTEVSGLSHGYIRVTLKDGSKIKYRIFNTTSERRTHVHWINGSKISGGTDPDTYFAIVGHPTGRKLALVNIVTGEIYDKKFSAKRPLQKGWILIVVPYHHNPETYYTELAGTSIPTGKDVSQSYIADLKDKRFRQP